MGKMTKHDTVLLISKLKCVYPTFGRDVDEKLLVETWYSELSTYDTEQVTRAYCRITRTSEFIPNIAMFHIAIAKFEELSEASPEEIWGKIHRVIGKTADLSDAFCYTYIEPGKTKTQGEEAREKVTEIWNNLPNEAKEHFADEYNFIRFCSNNTEKSIQKEKDGFLKNFDKIKQKMTYKGIPLTKNINGNNMLKDGRQ